jgi:hypothetical protein
VSLAEVYNQLEGRKSPDDFAEFRDFSENTKLVFLDKLREDWSNLKPETLAQIDKDYNFTQSVDPKIKQRWYWLGLVVDYDPVFEKAHEFVSTQGKTENLSFIYQALVDSNKKMDAFKWLGENR